MKALIQMMMPQQPPQLGKDELEMTRFGAKLKMQLNWKWGLRPHGLLGLRRGNSKGPLRSGMFGLSGLNAWLEAEWDFLLFLTGR